MCWFNLLSKKPRDDNRVNDYYENHKERLGEHVRKR